MLSKQRLILEVVQFKKHQNYPSSEITVDSMTSEIGQYDCNSACYIYRYQ